MFRKFPKWVLISIFSLGLSNSGCASEMVKKASLESELGKINEFGFIISQNKFIPENVKIKVNDKIRIWMVNMDKDPIQVNVNSGIPAKVVLGFKQINKLDIETPKVGDSYDVQYINKTGVTVTAKVNVTEDLQNNQVVILQEFQAFVPINTLVNADEPLTVHIASITWAPHNDFIIYGTDNKLPFKNGVISQLEIKDGLKAGEYPISRPNYPKQNHSIKTKVIAISKTLK
jgi:hypothetical protein